MATSTYSTVQGCHRSSNWTQHPEASLICIGAER